MPIIEILPISLDDAFDLLERLNDTSSVAEVSEVVEFNNDIDPAYYRLRWADAHHLIENVWTFPIKGGDGKGWLAEYAPDSKILKWVQVWFMTPNAHSRFMRELMAAAAISSLVP